MCGEWGPGCVSGDTLCVVNGGPDVFLETRCVW